MEVKSVYLNLQEGKKNGNVWRLESEAFKDPIEIKIVYDNKELRGFNEKVDGLKSEINANKTSISLLGEEVKSEKGKRAELTNSIVELQEKDNKLDGEVKENKSDLKELYKVIADLRQTVEMQSGTILHLQDRVKLLEKKVTKQPTVIHDKGFISGHESAGLGMIELPDGEYLMVMNVKIGEHNEYVENKDEMIVEKIHVEGQHYVPFYKLEGGTELDHPTATIYYDLIFMPV